MAMSMKANGETIKLLAKASTLTLTGRIITVNGWMTSSTDMDRRYGLTELGIRETTLRGRSTERVILSGLMGLIIWEILKIIIYMDEEFTAGLMGDDLMGTGLTTKWTEKEFSRGKMEEDTKELTKKIKRKDMEYLPGQTAECTTVNGT